MDVMFYEVFKEEEQAIRQVLPTSIKAGFTVNTIQVNDDLQLPSPVICIRTQSHIPAPWSNQLKGILTRSQGFDHVTRYLKENKATLSSGYLGDYCSRSVAEHAIGAMFVLLKNIKQQIRQFDNFERDNLSGRQCLGRNVLVVGVGNIGLEIVKQAQALGMQVKGIDIVQQAASLEYVDLKEGIAWAEIIVCALPLTGQTHEMLNYENLKNANPGTLLINISRGEITPIKDLYALYSEGILGALSLDVYPNEGVLAEHLRGNKEAKEDEIQDIFKLKDKDNVLFTPHNAFNTMESTQNKARLTVDSLVAFFKDGSFPNPVPS